MAPTVLNVYVYGDSVFHKSNYLRKYSPSNVTDLQIKQYKVKCQGIVHVTNVVGCTGKYLKTILKLRGKKAEYRKLLFEISTLEERFKIL